MEKKIAQALSDLFNRGLSDYEGNADELATRCHRYIQNEIFLFFMHYMKALSKAEHFDGRNRYAVSMAKKIQSFLDENEFVYANYSDYSSTELIPYKEWKESEQC